MNDSAVPMGVDLPFRQTGLHLIKTRLKDAQKFNDPKHLQTLDELAKKFEQKVFVKATSRDEYIKIIEKKLAHITNMRPASPITGNPLERNVIPRPIIQSSSAQQNFNQNPNLVSSKYQPSRMQIPAMQQPKILAVQNHQPGQQIQQTQNRGPLINPQGPITQYPECRLNGVERSSPYVRSQNYSGASALSSISDSGTTKLDHLQLLIDQFQRAKLAYLPELHKWLKTMEGHFSQVQSVGECETLKKHILSVRQMIRFLSINENQLMQFDKQKLRHNMNTVIEYYNKVVKNGISFAMNQAHQLSSLLRMASNPVHMNQPLISSSTINPGFSSGPIISTKQMDMKSNTITNLVTHGSANYDNHLNMRNDRQIQSPQTQQSVSQLEKRKHPVDSASVPNICNTPSKLPGMGKSSTNATIRTSKKPCSKPRGKSSGNSLESWLNLATFRSKQSSIPTKPSQSSTPSTPMTPSSGNNGEIETVKEASNPQEHLILEDLVPTVGAPEILSGSPMLYDSTGLEPNQQHPEKQPIDRLLDVVKLASKETLASAVNDMNSAIIEMDKLPDIAYLDPSNALTIDVDLAKFVENMHYDCMNDEDQQPFKRPKRDIESVSRDASFPPNNNSIVEQSSSLELNKNHIVMRPYQKFLDEIKDANQNLSGTVIEIMEELSNQSNGTIVRCTYSPNADNLRSMFTSQSMNLSVEFLVPFEYPTSPPKILDCKMPDFEIVIEMTEMAKSMFESQVRFIYFVRVGEMARLWDRCAQSVFLTYEKLFGAEIFSSENGGGDRAGPDT
ncbi:uncharacterized protein LOC141598515 [Silene latifolia]|uniref:uncharacterized protein LOC141598515 n=1 Tax=Silene latifolia TaxID=37657 RepID=UPI003D7806EF